MYYLIMKNKKNVQSEKLKWAGDLVNSISGKNSQITNCEIAPRFRSYFNESCQH